MMRRASVSGPFGSSIAVLTAALLAVGAPATTQGASIAPAPDVALLSVSTDPAGATVYVDGAARGVTPLDLSVTPGEHRVRVEKDGFLENSRLVSVAAGQARPLRVHLTRHAQVEDQPRPQPTPAPDEGGGGSGKKIALIGLGLVAVGGAAYYFLTKNSPPVVQGVNVSPGGTGLQGATNFTITASGASDPDGDQLTFTWNLGDGSSATGQSVNKVYATAGTFAISLTVSDGEASATANGSVTVRSLAGAWSGTLAGQASTTVTFAHSGSGISGTVVFPNVPLPNATLSGTVANPRAVTFTVSPPGFIPFTFAGTADESLNRLSGTVNGSGFVNAPWTLTR